VSGSTRKVIKLGKTVKNTSYTPPSPIKATHTSIASDSNDVSTASVSKAGDVMMTSSDQTGKLLKKKNVTPNKDPPEGKTTAIVAVMRGRLKHSHHRQRSNKHYKRKWEVCHNNAYPEIVFFIKAQKNVYFILSHQRTNCILYYVTNDICIFKCQDSCFMFYHQT
jgi:hypothetical protein